MFTKMFPMKVFVANMIWVAAIACLIIPLPAMAQVPKVKVGTLGAPSTSSWMVAIMEGRQIDIKDDEQVVIEGGLDPDLIAAIIKRYGPQIQHCYEKGLVLKPTIKGKVTTNFIISSSGGVIKPKIIEGEGHPCQISRREIPFFGFLNQLSIIFSFIRINCGAKS